MDWNWLLQGPRVKEAGAESERAVNGSTGVPSPGSQLSLVACSEEPSQAGGWLWLLSESAENRSGDGWVDVQREGDEIWVSALQGRPGRQL